EGAMVSRTRTAAGNLSAAATFVVHGGSFAALDILLRRAARAGGLGHPLEWRSGAADRARGPCALGVARRRAPALLGRLRRAVASLRVAAMRAVVGAVF